MALPEERQKFVADTRDYSGPLREAARLVDQFADKNSEAALAARRMGLAAKEAADKAARAQRDAADAAEALARGELSADEAANSAAKAERELERASIKAAEAMRAAGRAADQNADQLRQLRREAELTAAASHLAALKQVGDTKSYNAALTRLRKTHGDLSKTAVAGFEEIEDSGSTAFSTLNAAGAALSKAGPLWVVGAVNAIALLPEAASVAGDGITLGLGAALAGIGLKAQAGTEDVRATFSKLKTDLGSEMREISEPFHATWLHIAADARNGFEQIKPALEDAFHDIAPAVSSFSTQLTSALSGPRVQAAIRAIGKDFSIVMDSFGPATADAIGDVADGIKSISDAAAANPGALAGLVSGVGQLTKVTLQGVGLMIRYKSAIEDVIMTATYGGPLAILKFAGSVKDGTESLLGLGHGLESAGVQQFPTFEQSATAAAAATGHLMTAQQAAALTTDQLKTALDKLTGANLGAFGAETQYREALVAANAQAKTNNAGIDGNSKAALENRQSLEQLATAIKGVETSSHPTAAAMEKMRKDFVSAAEGMGLTRKEAVALAGQLLGLKPPPPVKLSADDSDFMAKLHEVKGATIDPKTGLLKGNNTDYLNKWLVAKGLRIDPKTGLFKGNNADYYNKWAAANHLRIDPKTGRILGNTSAFWSAVNSIPQTVGYRQIGVYYVPLNSANEPGHTRADGGIDRYANGGIRRDLPPLIATGPTVLFGETQTGGEAYIPLGGSKRARSTELLGQVADMFGLELVKPLADGVIEKYAKGKIKSSGMKQSGWGGTHDVNSRTLTKAEKAAQARVALAKARPEYLAAIAAQQALERMRATMYGGIFRGGASPIGSAHGSVVQHVTNVTLNVGGSILTNQQVVEMVRRGLSQRSVYNGTPGTSVPRSA